MLCSYCRVSFVAAQEFLVLTLPSDLAAGPVSLSFVFSGTLNDRLEGFYRSSYAGM